MNENDLLQEAIKSVKLLLEEALQGQQGQENELLREQIVSLKLLLQNAERNQIELYQEILSGKKETQLLNWELQQSVEDKQPTLTEAKNLALQILISGVPVEEALATLIGYIYKTKVEPLELKPEHRSTGAQGPPHEVAMQQLESISS